MAQVDVVCNVLNEKFLHTPFQIPDLLHELDGTNISLSIVGQTIHYARLNGFITPNIVGASGAKRKTYTMNQPIPSARVKRSQEMAIIKSKGITNPNMFSDANHPSKKHITNHFYSTFATYCNNTKSILALCGPNTDRFITNVQRITNSSIGNISLVECDPVTASGIDSRLKAYSKTSPFPPYQMYNVRLEDFLGSGFYQFQELDAEGNWNLLYDTYHQRLIEQASDHKHIKGMIMTTFARREGISKLNEYFSVMLANLGASFRDRKVIDTSATKKLLGDWHYVHLYDTFPKCINMGRIEKLLVYRYAQRGCQMFTSLIIYK